MAPVASAAHCPRSFDVALPSSSSAMEAQAASCTAAASLSVVAAPNATVSKPASTSLALPSLRLKPMSNAAHSAACVVREPGRIMIVTIGCSRVFPERRRRGATPL